MSFYDETETRSRDERAADLAKALSRAVDDAKHTPGMARALREIEPEDITSLADLTRLPVMQRADLAEAQARRPPFGGMTTRRPTEFDHLFMSGTTYGPGRLESDWWRMGRFMHASDVANDDVMLNSFSYHLSPWGMMFESGARAVGAVVLPAGPSQTDLQLRAARDVGATVYAGTPDFLRILLERAGQLGLTLDLARAVVANGALSPALRKLFRDHGIMARQCYAGADLGLLAYESEAMEGMIVDEGVILEIVRPGTGEPVPEGEIGEVLVTLLNPDYPMIRLATGDLSAVLPGESPCGRTNLRIRGLLGRVDQTSKINGIFIHPGQIAKLVARFPELEAARILIDRDSGVDRLTVQLETASTDPAPYDEAIFQALRLRGRILLVPPGSLPRDGKVIEDRREAEAPPDPASDTPRPPASPEAPAIPQG